MKTPAMSQAMSTQTAVVNQRVSTPTQNEGILILSDDPTVLPNNIYMQSMSRTYVQDGNTIVIPLPSDQGAPQPAQREDTFNDSDERADVASVPQENLRKSTVHEPPHSSGADVSALNPSHSAADSGATKANAKAVPVAPRPPSIASPGDPMLGNGPVEHPTGAVIVSEAQDLSVLNGALQASPGTERKEVVIVDGKSESANERKRRLARDRQRRRRKRLRTEAHEKEKPEASTILTGATSEPRPTPTPALASRDESRIADLRRRIIEAHDCLFNIQNLLTMSDLSAEIIELNTNRKNEQQRVINSLKEDLRLLEAPVTASTSIVPNVSSSVVMAAADVTTRSPSIIGGEVQPPTLAQASTFATPVT